MLDPYQIWSISKIVSSLFLEISISNISKNANGNKNVFIFLLYTERYSPHPLKHLKTFYKCEKCTYTCCIYRHTSCVFIFFFIFAVSFFSHSFVSIYFFIFTVLDRAWKNLQKEILTNSVGHLLMILGRIMIVKMPITFPLVLMKRWDPKERMENQWWT